MQAKEKYPHHDVINSKEIIQTGLVLKKYVNQGPKLKSKDGQFGNQIIMASRNSFSAITQS
jgi:hypothetical protein